MPLFGASYKRGIFLYKKEIMRYDVDMDAAQIQQKITDLEVQMMRGDFWSDKERAQATIREVQELKDKLAGVGKYDRGPALVNILSGAGGVDAEDFSRMLYQMYAKFCERKNLQCHVVSSNENEHGGYRNIAIEIDGKGAYGMLMHENGVHRLVRLSPFNAQSKRQTSFSMVEVVPLIDSLPDFQIKPEELEIEFTRTGGPGGQNVNKRETAVRITHKPSGITVRADNERTQEANRTKAMQIINGKIAAALEEARKKDANAMKLSATQKIEWGNQIRSYVLHPYKLVKDHRTDIEIRDVEKVLEKGEIESLWSTEESVS
jgi:peptide chain release factor 2